MTNLLDLIGDTGMAPKPVSADPTPVQNKTEHVALELVQHFHNEARGEILVSTTGDESRAVWLRDVDIQCAEIGRRAPATTTHGKSIQGGLPIVAVNLPEWLAREKGLI